MKRRGAQPPSSVFLMIRDFAANDIQFAVGLAIDEWGQDTDIPRDIVHAIGDAAIKGALDRTTFAKICEIDGKPVGLIFGSIKGDRVLFPDLERIPIETLPEEMTDDTLRIRATDDELLESCRDRGYDCELVYFISSRTMRGKGVGTALMESYMQYAESRGLKKMFLFTDDYSRYQFYEKKGFVRDACRTLFMEGKDHEFYIYSKGL